ncbi:unnamed protein product, partial [Medioppia subpectinata]
NKSNDNSLSDSNSGTNVSKVRKNIREFERRSSICGDTIVPPVVPVVGPVVQPKKDSLTASTHNNSNTTNDSNSMRMSKSCFEVDCCDNSSSGVSSDVDGEYGTQNQPKGAQMSQNNQQINRRNSQNVSEKIAVLMAATAQTSQAAAMAAAASAQSAATAQPVPIMSCQTAGPPTGAGIYGTRRTASCCDDSHKQRPKCWTNAGSGSQSMMGSAPTATGPSISSNLVPNLQQKSVKFTANYASNSEPKTNTTNNNAINSYPNAQPPHPQQQHQQPLQHQNKIYVTSQSKTGQPIRLQIDSLGLAAVNEVDVLAELVPPPPEFAAPPPGHPGANRGAPGSGGDPMRAPIALSQSQQL